MLIFLSYKNILVVRRNRYVKGGTSKGRCKKEKVVSIRMKPEDYAKVKRYAESSNKTITQVMQEGVAKLLDEKE